MYQIVRREDLTDTIILFDVEAPDVARACKAGQFIILRLKEYSERIPLTIADYDRDKGTITIIFQKVGKSTHEMAELQPGDSLLDFVGPLGEPSHVENVGTIIGVAGGVGAAPLFPILRELKAAGNKVITIHGAREKGLIFWEDKMREVSDEYIITTDDGSHGRKGLVTEPLKEILEKDKSVKLIYAIGPAIMMKFASLTTKEFGVETIVSLNSIMIDATGMCGGCRVSIEGKSKFACVDGPEFDGHLVDWNLLLSRQTVYKHEEKCAMDRYLEQKGAQ